MTVDVELKKIDGIRECVLHNREGVPFGKSSYIGETIAAQGSYLAMFGNRLGGIIGVGEMRSATVEGKQQHLLIYESRANGYLSITVDGEQHLGAVEGKIRAVFTKK